MKKICLLILFTLLVSQGFSQGMFTKRGNFSFDLGFGYVYSNFNENKFGSLAYNISSSIFGVFDIGGTYTKQSSGYNFKNIEGGTGYLDFYIKKDSLFGIVLNTAYSYFNYESNFLVGLSLYGSFVIKTNSIKTYPSLSIGILTTEDLAIGFGFAFEKIISDNFSLVLTPAVNSTLSLRDSENGARENSAQIILLLESIIKL